MTTNTIPAVSVQTVQTPEAVKARNLDKAIAAYADYDPWPNESELPGGVDILRILPNKAVHILSRTVHRGRRNRYSPTHALCMTPMGLRDCVTDCGCRAWRGTQACRHALMTDTVLNAAALKRYLAGRGEVLRGTVSDDPCRACGQAHTDTTPVLRLLLYIPEPLDAQSFGYGYLGGVLCGKCGEWRVNG